MNNDVPETLAAARSRAADLEQQLKLSDEGVSRLAQRCLELEQQVLNYQAALARHGSDNDCRPDPAAAVLRFRLRLFPAGMPDRCRGRLRRTDPRGLCGVHPAHGCPCAAAGPR